MATGAVDELLTMHGDESYELDVPTSGRALLRANATAGV
jgi:hypothetical protein